MNRSDIEKDVAVALGGDAAAKANARAAVDAMVRSVSDALVQGDRVYIRDLGVFRSQIVPSRMVRNPATNKRTRAKKTSRVRFTPSTSLRGWIAAGKMPRVAKPVAAKVTAPVKAVKAAQTKPAKATKPVEKPVEKPMVGVAEKKAGATKKSGTKAKKNK